MIRPVILPVPKHRGVPWLAVLLVLMWAIRGYAQNAGPSYANTAYFAITASRSTAEIV